MGRAGVRAFKTARSERRPLGCVWSQPGAPLYRRLLSCGAFLGPLCSAFRVFVSCYSLARVSVPLQEMEAACQNEVVSQNVAPDGFSRCWASVGLACSLTSFAVDGGQRFPSWSGSRTACEAALLRQPSSFRSVPSRFAPFTCDPRRHQCCFGGFVKFGSRRAWPVIPSSAASFRSTSSGYG